MTQPLRAFRPEPPDAATTLLEELLEPGGTVVIHHAPPDEGYSLSGVLGGRRMASSGESVAGMLLAALGRGPKLRCLLCGRAKALAMFPRDQSRPQGRFPHCLECNTARAKGSAWYRRRASRRAA